MRGNLEERARIWKWVEPEWTNLWVNPRPRTGHPPLRYATEANARRRTNLDNERDGGSRAIIITMRSSLESPIISLHFASTYTCIQGARKIRTKNFRPILCPDRYESKGKCFQRFFFFLYFLMLLSYAWRSRLLNLRFLSWKLRAIYCNWWIFDK